MPVSVSAAAAFVAGTACALALATAAVASTSPDTDFAQIVALFGRWSQGTLGGAIRLTFLLVGIAIGVKTQRILVPLGVGLATFYMPSVVDGIFGALI